MSTHILVTLGPSSLNIRTVNELTKKGVDLFRINLSHTKLDDVRDIIENIQSWTNVPVCLDSEGAQIRNQDMVSEFVNFQKDDIVKIHHDSVVGDSNNISFTPDNVSQQLKVGDEIRVDFNSVCFCITEIQDNFLLTNCSIKLLFIKKGTLIVTLFPLTLIPIDFMVSVRLMSIKIS